MAFYKERRRAESFGQAALDYDKFRPQYPSSVVEKILRSSCREAPRVLDVGAGTGILTAQLQAAGCEVLAVEPDPQMAAVARDKGLNVEVSTFEDWNPAEQTFDIVSFGQSFHWVNPSLALPRIAHVLKPGGIMALAWNDIRASEDLGNVLESILERFMPATKKPVEEASREHPVLRELEHTGFHGVELLFEEPLHYSPDAWLAMVFTYSAQLTMEPQRRKQMFDEMFAAIPIHGVNARNRAQLILAQPTG